MGILRIILYPFSLLYGLGILIRNKFFDWGILKSTSFSIPVIGVGNLSTGGTGKTPHVEYLIELLQSDYKIAVLSRGYKRKTKGFYIVNDKSTVLEVGDEPLQMSKNYPEIIVAVDEKRVHGIESLQKTHPDVDLIILDDSFQHRYVTPKLNILLTDYYKMFHNNYLLPSGNLREPRSQAKRADALIISKTPEVFSPLDRKLIMKRVSSYKAKNIFFSYIQYKEWNPITEPARKLTKCKVKTIFLLTGIANPSALEEYLKRKCDELICFHYSDHYNFKASNLEKLKEKFNNTFSKSKIIITTQKDAMRLQKAELVEVIKDLPIFTIPMNINFHEKDKKAFDEFVKKSIKKSSKD
jgi:tetraacyldisaccharide 4'-kinase